VPRAKKPAAAPFNTGNNLPAVPPGLPYGQRQATQQALAAVPDKGPGVAVAPPAGGPAGGPPAGPQGAPDQAALMAALQNYQPPQGDLTAPTANPNEPVTAGLPSGPGPGPGTMQAAPDLIGAQLNAIFQQFPNDDLLRIIALHQQGR
jgi:hypothetical protein